MNKLQSIARRLVSNVKNIILGVPQPCEQNPIETFIKKPQQKYLMFERAIDYINYECIEGDILEFGVFMGQSLSMLSYAYRFNWINDMLRRIVGFDSFEGLDEEFEGHPRWKQGFCKINHRLNTILPVGSPVTPKGVIDLFAVCKLSPPELEVGKFSDVIPKVIGNKYKKAALVHIDCDLYEATRDVLNYLEPILQDGTMILFDDWFNYKGNPRKGEARAFKEFLEKNAKWEAIHYRQYHIYSNSFILIKRGE